VINMVKKTNKEDKVPSAIEVNNKEIKSLKDELSANKKEQQELKLAAKEKAAKLETMNELKPSGKPVKKEAPKKELPYTMRMIGGRMRKIEKEE